MLRFSLVVCVSLIFGITAKPYKPKDKLTFEAFQDTVMSIYDNGKVEVEPPEDVDVTDYDIDPRMMIWKSMTGSAQDNQPLKAEEDFDELYHPSVADLLKAQVQNLGALPASDILVEISQEDPKMNYHQVPEEDKDDIDHLVFSEVDSKEPEQDWDEMYHKAIEKMDGYLAPQVAEYKAGKEVHVVYTEPEKNEDELYHPDEQNPPVQTQPLEREVRAEGEVRVHLQPEEDMDELYHKDVPQVIPYQGDADPVVLVDVPSQWDHAKPEQDLDHIYHQ